MKYLLSKGADLELRNEKGQSALHVAVSSDHSCGSYRQLQTAQILLEHGANPNIIDDNGLTCLNKAIHDAELVALLIKYGADINLGAKPVLFSAITAQDLPTIKTLLQTGANCNTRQRKSEKSQLKSPRSAEGLADDDFYPVHYAACRKFDKVPERATAIEIVKLLLKHGADPYLEFSDDACVLHHILASGGVLEPFLEIEGLELEKRDPKGRTLLLAACTSSRGTRSPTNQQLVAFDPPPSETRKKTFTEGDPTAAQTLFEMGGSLEALDKEGNNALHHLILATSHNDEYRKTVSLFLDRAPSLAVQKNKKGYTPYHYAVQRRDISTCRELVKFGADPVEQDPEGNTSLHYLASGTSRAPVDARTLKEFLDLGVSVNTKNSKGESPLFQFFKTDYAWDQKHQAPKDFAPYEEAGADLFVTNDQGETLLHVVAKRRLLDFRWMRGEPYSVVDTFKFLMEKGLDPMKEDRNQRSALVSWMTCERDLILTL